MVRDDVVRRIPSARGHSGADGFGAYVASRTPANGRLLPTPDISPGGPDSRRSARIVVQNVCTLSFSDPHCPRSKNSERKFRSQLRGLANLMTGRRSTHDHRCCPSLARLVPLSRTTGRRSTPMYGEQGFHQIQSCLNQAEIHARLGKSHPQLTYLNHAEFCNLNAWKLSSPRDFGPQTGSSTECVLPALETLATQAETRVSAAGRLGLAAQSCPFGVRSYCELSKKPVPSRYCTASARPLTPSFR